MIKVPCVLGCCLGPKHGQHRERDIGEQGLAWKPGGEASACSLSEGQGMGRGSAI